jgi:glutathione synthase/RimK-type ligase-like ATP-grasp enzyme
MFWFATSPQHADLTKDDRLAVLALEAAGLDVAPVTWGTRPPGMLAGDTVVVRSCWDYHLAPERFLAWLEALRADDIEVANGVDHIAWNMHKRYLLELQKEHGIAIPRTLLVQRGASTTLADALAAVGAREVVVKPAISLSSHNTRRMKSNAADRAVFAAQVADEDVLVQPYLDEIEEGELSLLFFGGAYSHAVLKRPARGDFRVQKDFGGEHTLARPPLDVIAQAGRVLRATGEDFVYARVDGVVADGRFVLMELELIDPVLFLEFGGDAAVRRFVSALTRRHAQPVLSD